MKTGVKHQRDEHDLINVYQTPSSTRSVYSRQQEQTVEITGLSPQFLRDSLTIVWEEFRSTRYGIKNWQLKEPMYTQGNKQTVILPATLLPYLHDQLAQQEIPFSGTADPNGFSCQSRQMVNWVCDLKSQNIHHLQFNRQSELVNRIDQFLCNYSQSVVIAVGFKKQRHSIAQQLQRRGHVIQDDIGFESGNDVYRAIVPINQVELINPDIWRHLIMVEGVAAVRENIPQYIGRTQLNCYLYTTKHETQQLGPKDRLRLEWRFGRPSIGKVGQPGNGAARAGPLATDPITSKKL